jgi:lipopolysaccharide transport system permease protein/teichoic acid transport system permease protein
MVIQFAFWLTPIFWSIKKVPEQYQWLIKLNPFFYIVNGYRDSLIYHKWFWEDMTLTIYFWTVTLVFLVTGTLTFKKLRPYFADVL